MYKKRVMVWSVLFGLALLAVVAVQLKSQAQRPNARAEVLGTAFTYQGQLGQDGQPVDDTCDLRFSLYQDELGNVQIGASQTIIGVVIEEGLFTVQLDFGAGAFQGDGRWLGIQVQCSGDDQYADLGIQALTATPYALYALAAPWDGLSDIPAGFADGVDDMAAIVSGTAIYAGEGLNQFASGNAVTMSIAPGYRLPQACADGQIAEWDGSAWLCGDDDVGIGDSTTVYAGEGLTRSVSGDAITLSLASPYRLPQICASGQIAEWDGSAWLCGEDDVGLGDVTAVYAGEGLTGGGESGDVTVTVAFSGTGDATYAARADHHHDERYYTESELSVGGGGAQVHWDNLTNLPPGLADGDDDTTYSPGAGLVLSGTTFSVVFSGTGVADAAARADHRHDDLYPPLNHAHAGEDIVTGTVDQARIDSVIARDAEITPTVWASDGTGSGLDADLLDGQDSSYYQARVAGGCAVGSTIRAIAPNGTVICQSDAPLHRPAGPAANSLTTLDNSGDVGQHGSITLGSDGLGLLSYYDASNGDLKVAHCDDLTCSTATHATLDSSGNVGQYTSIAIGTDGLALISYYDASNSNLKVAHCNDLACSSATATTLDSTGDVGLYTSIAIGADGLGLISYRDATNRDLKVAHCQNLTCNSASLYTLDSGGNVGQYISIALGADGRGLISYYDVTNYDLKVAHCNDLACSSATVTTLDSTGITGQYTWVAIGADGLGLISYHDASNGYLRVAHCQNPACTSATLASLDSPGSVNVFTSITVGADGLGLISYYADLGNELRVAHCTDLACSNATVVTLDSLDNVGWYNATTIGADGLGLIGYYDWTGSNLKVAHCANPFCTPYFRRR